MAATGDLATGTDLVNEAAETRRNLRRALLGVFLADLVMLVATVVVAWDLRLTFDVWSNDLDPSQSLASTAGPWIVLAWLLVLVAQGAYSPRLFGSGADEYRTVLVASLLTAGAVGMFCYLMQLQLSRGFVLLAFFIGVPVLLAERYVSRKALHYARMHGRLVHRVVAVGGPSGISEVVAVLEREKYVGYRIVGACVRAPDSTTLDSDGLRVPVLGSVDQTREACAKVGADTVLVARGAYASSGELRQIAWDLEGSDIDLVVVPSLTDVAGPRIHMRPVAGLPLLHLEEPLHGEAGGWGKRVFDVTLASLILLALSPVLLVVAALVKKHDGGPVFFRQNRIGRAGQPFKMIKFRSMVVDAEARLAEVAHLNESDAVLFKVRHDPRITPVGRVLRKFSIDEMPQLLNVLRGDMSLVGPRPPLPAEVDTYATDVSRRLLVRPGMTGLWQVSGRSSLSWDESVRLDLYYVDNWSMSSDLMIMAKTVKAVVASEGAY